jgi:phospholipase C
MGHANIYILNNTDSPADVYLYHAQLGLDPGLINTACAAFPGLASMTQSPTSLAVSWDDTIVADYWGVMISVSGGSRPGVYVTAPHPLDPRYYRESLLEDLGGDDGSSPVFTVDWDTFNIKLISNGSHHDPVPMMPVGPYSPVTNVFVLMLENHSFDNILGLSGISGITPPGPQDCNSYNGNSYCVNGMAPVSMASDPGHEFLDVVKQLCGPNVAYTGPSYPGPIDMSGFAASYATTTDEDTPPPPPADIGQIMACFGAGEIKSLLPSTYNLASNYVVCDSWFSSLPGPTWPNRFFLHLASSEGLNYSPSIEQIGSWEIDGVNSSNSSFPGASSIFDSLNTAGIPYAIYQDLNGPISGSIALVTALKGIDQGIEVTGLYPDLLFNGLAADLQRPYPYRYTFIEPNYGDSADNTYEGGSSQHPMDSATSGDALIGYIYGTLAKSPLWRSSVLIITYDEHGGFYDHVVPPGNAVPPGDALNPAILPPNDGGLYKPFDFRQLGVRVPAVVVSPLIANTPQVDHTTYDHTSVLATIEKVLGLSNLTARDRAASDLTRLWQPSGAVPEAAKQAFVPKPPLQAPAPPPARLPLSPDAAAERSARLQRPLPPSGNLIGFISLALKAELNLGKWTPEERAAMIARVKAIKTRAEADDYINQVAGKIKVAAATRKSERETLLSDVAAAKRKTGKTRNE